MNLDDEPRQHPCLTLENVSVNSNLTDNFLLNNINLKIAPQEKIGIVGASGAGKSTLLKLLNYLHSPNQGKFLFQGRSIQDIEAIKFRQQVVLVPQEPKLLGMKVQSALTYPLQLQKLTPAQIKQRLSWCLETFSIPNSWLSRQEAEISLGQRQLISIARGFMMSPSILLLDEPTSALDTGKSIWLQEILKKSINPAMTIVVVNHDLQWIRGFANRVIWLNRGSLEDDSTACQFNWSLLEAELAHNNINQDLDDF